MPDKLIKFSLKITSGKINVADPYFAEGTWCAAWDLPAKNGEWASEVKMERYGHLGKRVTELKSLLVGLKKRTRWRKLKAVIGVDSGQCGIFDASVPVGRCEGVYEECREVINGVASHGIIRVGSGIVSSSGFGEGYFLLYGMYEDGVLVGLKIIFITKRKVDLLQKKEHDPKIADIKEA